MLKAFLGREMSAPLREDGGRYVRQALTEGQAFLLLDGIDELGDRTARENFRSAVFDGMARYPDYRWLLTSRIVGYDEVPFDSVRDQRDEPPFLEEPDGELRDTILHRRPRGLLSGRRPLGLLPMRPESRGGQIPIRYIAPFDDRRIAAFARNWYVRREASASRASTNADHLVRAVHADESILRLARVPNLLTMMALIHRIEATLPHGRALLYERIAEAYLESIDKFRGIESSPHDLPRKKGWLARVGFEMQRLRTVEDETDETNILMDAAKVREWLSEEMGRSEAVPDTPSAEEFLKVTGRRSGLFLPRGEGRYAFVHLSFQEYFAAFALKREVTRLRWAKGNASRLGFDRAILAGLGGGKPYGAKRSPSCSSCSHPRRDDDWHADLLDCVFGKEFSRLDGSESDEVTVNLGYLLARLIVNSRSGLPTLKRDEAIAYCVKAQFRTGSITSQMSSSILSQLVGEDSRLNAKTFEQIGIQMEEEPPESRKLDFQGAQLSDIRPLADLPSFQSLDLQRTQVSDLRPLANLTALERLDLADTPVSDLEPLANLVELQYLRFSGTQVLDLTPLASLAALESLYFWQTEVSDLGPLANLTALEDLYFGGTQVLDLTPLANLAALESLGFWQTEVSDLGPLANLTALESLHFGGTQVSDLTPLEGLAALEHLSLWYTDVSDLGPLLNLAAIKSLDIAGTQASDLGPFVNLTALQELDLENIQVSDLGPLAGLVALRELQLGGTQISDIGPLENLTALEQLSLKSTQVSEIRPLANLTSLKWLDLRQTRVSVAAVEDLRTLRPALNIVYQD